MDVEANNEQEQVRREIMLSAIRYHRHIARVIREIVDNDRWHRGRQYEYSQYIIDRARVIKAESDRLKAKVATRL